MGLTAKGTANSSVDQYLWYVHAGGKRRWLQSGNQTVQRRTTLTKSELRQWSGAHAQALQR